MNNKLPLLITKSVYIFPGFNSEIPIGVERSKKTIAIANENHNQHILLVSKRNTKPTAQSDLTNIFSVGVLCAFKINKKLANSFLVRIKSLERVFLFDSTEKEGVFYSDYRIFKDKAPTKQEEKTLSKVIFEFFDKMGQKIPEKWRNNLVDMSDVSKLFNTILHNYEKNKDNFKQKALETDSLLQRYRLIKENVSWKPLKNNLNFSKLIDQSIDRRITKRFRSQQKEYLLREKLKAIREELGETDPKEKEINKYLNRLEKEPFPQHVKDKLREEINRYQVLPPFSGETGMIKHYIDWVINLPWCQTTNDENSLANARKILDANHFGLKKPKERIIEHLAANFFTKKQSGQIICLVGPPGVGKTSLGFSIAQAMKKKFVRIALGGVKDEAEIRGHRRTYLGSMPGKIIQALKSVKTCNPVILIDEIDKLSSDFRGDPASAMLEVLDPGQNKQFTDHYIEESFDLSKVVFIATANYEWNIPPALYDRMEIIRLSSYTEFEKIKIAEKYLIPETLKELGLTSKQIVFETSALKEMVKFYTRESGVRELKRLINNVCRKLIVKLLSKSDFQLILTNKNVVKYLGKRLFEYMEKNKQADVGVVTGLAYTQFGGDILPIETTIFEGSGRLILTGKLGQVMKESANIAYDYIKSSAKSFGINFAQFAKNDIHIHFPEGAIPKDGPSAGVTITTALISLLKGIKVSNDLAMTGEITLRGKILPIGGLREKTIAATRSGISKVIIPKANKKDVDSLPKEVKDNLEIILAVDYTKIFQYVFVKSNAEKKSKTT